MCVRKRMCVCLEELCPQVLKVMKVVLENTQILLQSKICLISSFCYNERIVWRMA